MATLLIGDNEFNGRIVCEGNVNTECSSFINYGDGVEVIHLYVSSGYISTSLLQLYSRALNSTEEWILDFETSVGGYNDYVWQGLIVYGSNTEYKVTYKGLTKYYTVLSPCTPDWQCREPLDGYETDINNCGENDRYNVVCEPTINPCPDICIETDLWYQKYDYDLEKCVPDTIHFNNAEECGGEPVIICRKGCAIDGSYDYYTGNLVDGECEYIENSELCGYVDPDASDTSALVVVGIIGASIVGLLLNKK